MSETDQAKQKLVDCIRMLERSDIIDHNGHASIRTGENRMFINIGSCQRSLLTLDDICTIDFDGNLIEGTGKPPLEFHLHAGIYKAMQTGKPNSFSKEEMAACRAKLWNENLFKRAWDHFRAKLDAGM